MAAIEREEIERREERHSGARLALVKPGAAAAGGDVRALPPSSAEQAEKVDEFEARARSWRGWWRTFQIVRVLGTMALYLFLNDYDVRAAFNARIAARKLEEAKGRGRYRYFKARARDLVLHRLRDERRFSGVEELTRQIERDAARARKYFARAGVRRSLSVI